MDHNEDDNIENITEYYDPLVKENKSKVYINRPLPKVISLNPPSRKLFSKDKFVGYLMKNNLLNITFGNLYMPDNENDKRKLLYDSYIDFIKPLFPMSEFNNIGDITDDRTIVFFESRVELTEQIVFLCSVFSKLLGPSWAIQIIVTKEVIERIKTLFPIGIRFKIQYITVGSFDYKSYSRLALDATILKQIPQENQLWIQTDSLIYRYSDFNEWTKYDYLGAPWSHCPANDFSTDPYEPICYYGGNGSTSFRKRSVMLKLFDIKRPCCESYKNCQSTNILSPYECHELVKGEHALLEDCYIIHEMRMLGINNFKLAGFRKRINFSFETTPSKLPLLSHKVWEHASYRDIFDAFMSTDY